MERTSYNETTKFCTQEDIIADNWYSILECSINSTQQQIEDAYKRLARQYHPDKNPDPEAVKKFYRINDAYQILGDREIRAYYDYESGNTNNANTFRFKPHHDISDFKRYIDNLTQNKITAQSFGDQLWDQIATKYITSKSEFNRNLNIVGTLDITRKSLQEGIRTAFPLYRYRTCSVCRGVGKIGVKTRDICYNCEGYGIEDERIFVYVEIPKNYRVEKLFKVPGRGHKVPAGIGDLIININVATNFGLKTRILHSIFKNRGLRED